MTGEKILRTGNVRIFHLKKSIFVWEAWAELLIDYNSGAVRVI